MTTKRWDRQGMSAVDDKMSRKFGAVCGMCNRDFTARQKMVRDKKSHYICHIKCVGKPPLSDYK